MTFYELIHPYRRLAIVGTAKNVGKTTTLNGILRHYEDTIWGLSSVGRDGEPTDMITERPKPKIAPPVGSLVATAKGTIIRATARLSLVAPTPFRTAMGPVGIYRVESPGHVEIAGPVAAEDALDLIKMLEKLGAQKVLIDGAIDRRASAAIAEAVILATGMSLDDSPEEVRRQTLSHCQMLQLEPPPFEVETQSGYYVQKQFHPLPGRALEQGIRIPEEADTLVIEGALTEGLCRPLLHREPLNIVVPDGTHLVMGPTMYHDMQTRHRFYASRPILLLAVTVNPTRPYGKGIDPRLFLDNIDLPVPTYDLVLEQEKGIADAAIH